MKWIAQVRHVAAKDLRTNRWTLAVYLGFLAIVTAVSTGWPTIGASGLSFLALLLLPIAMGIGAMLMQNDSAVSVDAFWATRPLDWTALLSAKAVGAAAAIVLPGLVAQANTLLWFQVNGMELVRDLAASALAYGAIVLIGMFFGSFVRSIAAWMAVLVASLVAALLIGALTAARQPLFWVPASVGTVASIVTQAAAVLVVAYLYRTRDVTRGRWLAAIVLVAWLGGDALVRPRPVPVSSDPSTRHAHVTAAEIPEATPRALALTFRADSAEPGDLATAAPSLRWLVISYDDGKRDSLDGYRGAFAAGLNVPAVQPRMPVTWRNQSTWGGDTMKATVEISETQAAALLAGTARVQIAGEIDVRHQIAPAVLPFRRGGRTRVPLAMFEIDSLSSGLSPAVHLRSAALGELEIQHASMAGFAVVNRARGVGVYLTKEGSSSGPSTMPLPGVDERMTEMTLKLNQSSRDTIALTAEWLAGAEMLIARWGPAQRFRIDTIVSVRVPASMSGEHGANR